MADDSETAILAGGCFWIMQQLLRQCDGVISTRAGWTGGSNDHPTEEDNEGHVEAVEVVFDPERLPYPDLLDYFFQVHRPDLGADVVGSAYRSEIFCASPGQREVAVETIAAVDASGHWPGKVTTAISDAERFWDAGAEDQDWFQRYSATCPNPFPRRDAGPR